MMSEIKILIILNHYLPGYKSGGPIQSISNLSKQISKKFKIYILTLDRDATDNKPYTNININKWNTVNNNLVYYMKNSFIKPYYIYNVIKKEKFDKIHINSLFNLIYSMIPILIIKLIKNKYIEENRVILSIRGELGQGALEKKKIKKKIALYFIRKLNVYYKLVWHVTSIQEKEELINVFNKKKLSIKVIPNLSHNKINVNTEKFRTSNDILRIVYLARIDSKKNILFALDILSKVKINVVYDIYGPIREKKYWNLCLKKIELMPNNITVNYHGGIEHASVHNKLAEYDMFFLPTKNENYGHSIVEAAFAGVPLLISNCTPWRNLKNKGVGWDLPLDDKDQFCEAIIDYYSLSNSEKLKMRSNVVKWAEFNHNSDGTINNYEEMYLM